MFTKNLALASLVVASLFAGCGEVPTPEEAAQEAVRGGCPHSGRYILTIGARISGDDGCLYRPTVEDVILPGGPASVACSTTERHDYRLAIDPRIAITDQLRCAWTASGNHADCILDETADEGQATCSAGYVLTYDRVPVVAW